MTPKRALTRKPGRTFTACLSSHPMSHTVNYEKAMSQHARYRAALADLGLEVMVLESDDSHPDACFVEDNAVVHGDRALVCRMGAESRRGEEGAVELALKELGIRTKRAQPPATVEGGDVVHLDDRFVSGVSQRTNKSGVEQLSAWLGMRVDTIEDPKIMHLKSYVSFIGQGTVMASKRYARHDALRGLSVIVVPEDEEYAADAIAVGGSVVLPKGMSKTCALLEEAGFTPVEVDVGEFEKCDGAVTCLSILF